MIGSRAVTPKWDEWVRPLGAGQSCDGSDAIQIINEFVKYILAHFTILVVKKELRHRCNGYTSILSPFDNLLIEKDLRPSNFLVPRSISGHNLSTTTECH